MNRNRAFSLTLTLLVASFASSTALAKTPTEGDREVFLPGYDQPVEVVRDRTPGTTRASFAVAPTTIADDTLLVFEVYGHDGLERSSRPRWRCVAVTSSEDCFAHARSFRWQRMDERLVLHVVARDPRTPEGQALFAEAMARRSSEVLVADAQPR